MIITNEIYKEISRLTPSNEAVNNHKKILLVLDMITDYLVDGCYNKSHSQIILNNIMEVAK